MSKLTIIQLLNKIANGEEVPKRIRIDHWCYKFEWIEHQSNYYDRNNEIDLMSCLSCDKEELNYEVHEIEEEKKIPEKLGYQDNADGTFYLNRKKYNSEPIKILSKKINEIIDCLDYLKSKGE